MDDRRATAEAQPREEDESDERVAPLADRRETEAANDFPEDGLRDSVDGAGADPHQVGDPSRVAREVQVRGREPLHGQVPRRVVRGTRSAGCGELRPARLAHAGHDARLEPRVDDSRRDEVADDRAELDENSASGACGVSGAGGG